MGSVMGIDNQDFISKMEGFAVQGMKGLIVHHFFWPAHSLYSGAAMNHKQQVSVICSKIRNIINATLHESFSVQRQYI
jgi:hypothetical protein